MTGTVRDAVRSFLTASGVTKIFGNPGSTEMRFFKDWPDDLDYVMVPQEAPALAMADGYAQASGSVGVVMLHSAAGLGNALGSLFTAERNGTPLVIIAGQQSRSLLMHDPYLFARRPTEFPRPYVKFAVEAAAIIGCRWVQPTLFGEEFGGEVGEEPATVPARVSLRRRAKLGHRRPSSAQILRTRFGSIFPAALDPPLTSAVTSSCFIAVSFICHPRDQLVSSASQSSSAPGSGMTRPPSTGRRY